MSQLSSDRVLGNFKDLQKAVFTGRPNRFTVECLTNNRKERAYLPNPGRLWELLLPGKELYLARDLQVSERSTKYTVVAVKKEGVPVLLHTHHANTVAKWLIEQEMISGLEGYSILKPQVTMGRSRFDFLLKKDNQSLVLEVKSCTLFNQEIAMFPDAITLRGKRHLIELAELSHKGLRGGVLFIVNWPLARYFLPEYHTDLEFSRVLYDLKDHLIVKAISLEWKKDLSLGQIHELEIPWWLIEREAQDIGSYIIILNLKNTQKLSIGELGEITLEKGYYLYVGSARKNLTRRVQRHRRKRKKLFWHIDYLGQIADFHLALPVRSSADLECDIAKRLKAISDWSVPEFGVSDCSCETHLFGMRSNPIFSPTFIEILQHFRIGRLEDELMGKY
ncbi:sugar fermentation stimulation protein A [Candidatus Hakubella thermalkaliphila]|nr:sugar fermentation stimulation protein A [Candidatus Hakubella thermalkaliphila]